MSHSIGDTKLLDACRQPGCPVCRCVDEDSRRHIDGLLHELVTDLETRRALRSSWGFCNWHGAMALAVPGARTGTAILHADVLRTVSDRIRRANGRARDSGRGDWRARVATVFFSNVPATGPAHSGRAPCVVCRSAMRGEGRYVRFLCRVGEDEAVTHAYEVSDGVCVQHLCLAMERGRKASSLVESTLRKWEGLAALLDEFVKKHEYRNTTPFTEAEARACERAVETLSGRSGVWSNDLHAGARPRQRRAGTAGPRRP